MNFVKKLEIRSWKLEVCGTGLRAMVTDHGSRINGKLGSMNNNNGLSMVAGRINNGRDAHLPVNCRFSAGRPQPAACPARELNTRCVPGSGSHLSLTARRAAFSLAEILIAIFVLSIGLIMIASVFPVAAKWTAQDAQTSIAQVIAKNAVAQIRAQLAAGTGAFPAAALNSPTAPQPFTGYGPFAYQFGTAQPYPFGSAQAYSGSANFAPSPLDPAPAAPTPAPVPPPGSYYWSAVLVPAASGYAGVSPYTTQLGGIFTVYVFVFNKGDDTNVFSAPAYATPSTTTNTILPMLPDAQNGAASHLSFYPQLFEGQYPAAASAMPIDSLGVDVTTGSVFRLVTNPATNAVVPTGLAGGSVLSTTSDYVIFAPPAVNQTASPLVYVYVTTIGQ